MANCARPNNAPGLVVGLCFMALGALLLADRLGLLAFERAIAFWPVALILFGASVIVHAVRGAAGASGGRGFPLGAVIWLVLIGLFVTNVFERRGSARDQNRVHLFALLSGDRRTPPAEAFRGGEMTSVMGGTELDLRQARMGPGDEAVIDVFAIMGGAVVYVPKEWRVDLQTTAVMGGVKDERFERNFEVLESRGRGRRPRRQGAGRIGDPGPGQAFEPAPPRDAEAAEPPQPAEPPAPPVPPTAPEAIEREDPVPAADAPRIILRGFVMMGGLVVKS
jgi:hypothetical protein